MTLPRRKHTVPARAGSGSVAPTVVPANAVPAVASADDWQRAVEMLMATARQRDGDDAARHTEIRRRMRALARAARTLAASKDS